MVGVPCFFIWLFGPSSRIDWPNFSRCRMGIIKRPTTIPMTKLITNPNAHMPEILPHFYKIIFPSVDRAAPEFRTPLLRL